MHLLKRHVSMSIKFLQEGVKLVGTVLGMIRWKKHIINDIFLNIKLIAAPHMLLTSSPNIHQNSTTLQIAQSYLTCELGKTSSIINATN